MNPFSVLLGHLQNMEIASLSSQVASLHEQLDEQRAQVQLGDTAAGSQGDQETAEEKREVSSSKGLEHQLQKLQAEMAAVTTQSTEKDKRIADLKGGLSEALPKLQEAEKHITSLKEDIKVKAERIISLESEVKLMKESEAALEQAKEEAERKWKDERERCVWNSLLSLSVSGQSLVIGAARVRHLLLSCCTDC